MLAPVLAASRKHRERRAIAACLMGPACVILITNLAVLGWLFLFRRLSPVAQFSLDDPMWSWWVHSWETSLFTSLASLALFVIAALATKFKLWLGCLAGGLGAFSTIALNLSFMPTA